MGDVRDDPDFDSDAIADLLSHPIRRYIVGHLRDNGGVGLRYLSILVTRLEAERLDRSKTAIGFQRMQEEIGNEHIPLLEDAGVVEYNPDTEWLELNGAPTDCVDSALDEP